MKMIKKAANTTLPFPFEYLNQMPTTLKIQGKGKTVEDCLDIDVLSLALQAQTSQLIKETVKAYTESKQPDKVKDNDLFAQPKLMMIKSHMQFVQFHIFKTTVATLKLKDERIRKNLEVFVKIFALDALIREGAPAFDSGYFASGALHNLNKALNLSLL